MLNMHPEGESQYNPEAREGEERPKSTTLTRERFAQGSLGHTLFPDALEHRSRPETVFNKTLDEPILLQKNSKGVVFKRLAEKNIKTVDAILNLQETDLDPITPRKGLQRKIKQGLRHYLEGLIIPPHARLIETLYHQPQYPIPVEREQELIDAVGEKVNALKNKKDREFLIDRFGLYDGIAKSRLEITSRYGGFGKTTNMQTRALRNVHSLSGYITLPEESIARHAFNAVFYKDLQELPHAHGLRVFSIDLSNLSPSTIQELPKMYHFLGRGIISSRNNLVNTWELLQVDLQKAGVPQETQEEISRSVRSLYDRLKKPTTSY